MICQDRLGGHTHFSLALSGNCFQISIIRVSRSAFFHVGLADSFLVLTFWRAERPSHTLW